VFLDGAIQSPLLSLGQSFPLGPLRSGAARCNCSDREPNTVIFHAEIDWASRSGIIAVERTGTSTKRYMRRAAHTDETEVAAELLNEHDLPSEETQPATRGARATTATCYRGVIDAMPHASRSQCSRTAGSYIRFLCCVTDSRWRRGTRTHGTVAYIADVIGRCQSTRARTCHAASVWHSHLWTYAAIPRIVADMQNSPWR